MSSFLLIYKINIYKYNIYNILALAINTNFKCKLYILKYLLI